jgi:uncharacterized protein YuzE
MKKPKTIFDTENDIFWIIFKEGEEAYYEEYTPGFLVEFDKDSNPIGIEIKNWSKKIQSYPVSEKRNDIYSKVNFTKPQFENFDYQYNYQ